MPVPDHLARQRARILRAVHRAGHATQRDLVRATRLSASSVSVLSRQLLGTGALELERTEARGGGRPRTWLRLAADAGSALGLCVSDGQLGTVRVDLHGAVRQSAITSFAPPTSQEEVLTALGNAVAAAIATAGETAPLLGLGVVFSGVVDHAEGVLRSSTQFPSVQNVPVRAALAGRFDLPTTVDDRARALAIAEHRYGVARGVRDFLFVVADTGVGAGLFLDGRPYRGINGLAGEIGHLVVDPTGPLCTCGKRGCLETIAARPAIEQAARQVRASLLPPSLPAIAAAASADNPLAIGLLTGAGERLGQGIAAALNLFGVELVVLGGTVPSASPLVLDALRRTARRETVAGIRPRIALTALGADAAARGAATLALDDLFATDDHPLAIRTRVEERAAS